ncbi:Per1-like [Trema orientale]|uniref:Post-GPI attachment to proteins factor 3 n=1 Tax=Trema orientale TaxID=63057 RepID=A0A2P5CCL7_TREOI|nr:Per1-like [Trema orientale]
MAVAQLLIWAIFAGVTRHPSRWKLWLVVVAGGLAMLLEIYDFPPYQGFVDAHATTIPLTFGGVLLEMMLNFEPLTC